MAYKVSLPGFTLQTIEVQHSMLSGSKLLVNGQPAEKDPGTGQMQLRRDDGVVVIAKLRRNMMGFDVPSLVVDGQVVKVVEPLKWYEWLWIALPILLIFVGGALGVICGGVAVLINANIFRTNRKLTMKFLFTGLISLAAGVVYLVVAILLTALISR
jgi:hypothetical protein